ncbi:hypothetical protein PX699_00265 [Sphingobium sp. H39-3-25]|nr:hypothetical protein [Sphingobium arseniciresistens]
MSNKDLIRVLRKFYTNITPRSEKLLAHLRTRYLSVDEAIQLSMMEAMA